MTPELCLNEGSYKLHMFQNLQPSSFDLIDRHPFLPLLILGGPEIELCSPVKHDMTS
jgi:hypothetical protein